MVSVDTLFWFSVSDAFKVLRESGENSESKNAKNHQHPLRPTRRTLKRSFAVCCT